MFLYWRAHPLRSQSEQRHPLVGTLGTGHGGADPQGARWRSDEPPVFANGSFELSDLPVGQSAVAGALLAEVANGDDLVFMKLNPVPAEARFEKARQVMVRFKLDQKDRAEWERFRTGCRLLQRAS